MRNYPAYISTIALAVILTACDTSVPMVNVGIDDSYYVYRMQKLRLESALTGKSYRWTIDGETVGDSRDYIFLEAEEGTYDMTFEIIDDETPFRHDFTVTVMHEEIEYSPYISRVYEYCPAPGQFVNEMPKWEEGDTYADILKKTEESLSGTNDVMVSLGGYGGYVTFGFDHTVINRDGCDFRIWGNSFYELTDPARKGGSAEPGIVMVSFDTNCNGVPDDEWFELAGSEYGSAGTVHNYTITYHRPEAGHQAVPDDMGFITDSRYIAWDDSERQSGYIAKNMYHTQDYWPKWNDAVMLSFSGSRLAPNAEDKYGDGRYFILYCYGWGYADNHPNDYAGLNSFDISNAVDRSGRSVRLPGVDFIRVYTGVNQQCGWLGETSTEISRAADLNLPQQQ